MALYSLWWATRIALRQSGRTKPKAHSPRQHGNTSSSLAYVFYADIIQYFPLLLFKLIEVTLSADLPSISVYCHRLSNTRLVIVT